MTSPAIVALIEKRAELAGELRAAEERIDQLRSDLGHLDATLRIFDPEIVPRAIRPKTRRRATGSFRHGEFSRTVLDIVRRSGRPLSVREIVAEIAREGNVDITKKAKRNSLVTRVRSALARQKAGTVVKETRGEMAYWRIA